jgi:hypothetical protein
MTGIGTDRPQYRPVEPHADEQSYPIDNDRTREQPQATRDPGISGEVRVAFLLAGFRHTTGPSLRQARRRHAHSRGDMQRGRTRYGAPIVADAVIASAQHRYGTTHAVVADPYLGAVIDARQAHGRDRRLLTGLRESRTRGPAFGEGARRGGA